MNNVLSPVPSPVQLRAMLEEMVVGDLLGPAGGPEEELTERNVRDRYLVGVLAPRPQPQPTPAKVEEEDDEETPLLPDELSEGGADSVDDGTSADIQKLRELHVEMDHAVAAAYGWTDLHLSHGFHHTKQGLRYTISEAARREVLARLLKLNHERYAEEVRQGLHEKKKGGTGRKGQRKKKEDGGSHPLFGVQERQEEVS
jgi:hypothetical protein